MALHMRSDLSMSTPILVDRRRVPHFVSLSHATVRVSTIVNLTRAVGDTH